MDTRYLPKMSYWVVMMIGISIVGCGTRPGEIQIPPTQQIASAGDTVEEAQQNIADAATSETEKSSSLAETGGVGETDLLSQVVEDGNKSAPPILTDILKEVLFFQGGGPGNDLELPTDIPTMQTNREFNTIILNGFQPNERVLLVGYKKYPTEESGLPKAYLNVTQEVLVNSSGTLTIRIDQIFGREPQNGYAAVGYISGEATYFFDHNSLSAPIANNLGSIFLRNFQGELEIDKPITGTIEQYEPFTFQGHTWRYSGPAGFVRVDFEENMQIVQMIDGREIEIPAHHHGSIEVYNEFGEMVHSVSQDGIYLSDGETYRIVVLNHYGGRYTISIKGMAESDLSMNVADQSGPAISSILNFRAQFFGDSPGPTEFCTYEIPQFAMKITDESELDFVEMFFKFDIEDKPEGEWDAYPLTDFEIDNLNQDQYRQFVIPIDTRYKGTLQTYVVARDSVGNSTTSPVSNFRVGYCSDEEASANAREQPTTNSQEGETVVASNAIPEVAEKTPLASSDTILIEDLGEEIANASTIGYGPLADLILTSHDDGIVRLWNSDGTDVVRAFTIGTSEINVARFSPDGTQIAVAIRDEGFVTIVDAESGQLVHELTHERVYDVAFTGEGMQLLSRGSEGIRVWDISSGALVQSVNVPGMTTIHKGSGYLSGKSMIALTSSLEKPLRVWDLVHGKETVTLENNVDSPLISSVSGELSAGSNLFAASFCNEMGCMVNLWDAKTGAKLRTVAERGIVPNLVKFSSDETLLATAWENGLLQVWNIATGELVHESRHGDSSSGGLFMLEDLAFSPDNSHIAFIAAGGTPQIQNMK